MLEGSQYVVQALTEGKASNEIIDIAGKQRMLSQRIAKYYIAYQAGIKDDNTITQMKETVKEFDTILKKLIANTTNTLEIKKELAKVNKMWNIVYKFYLNIEKGGLPIIVFSTTDDITKKMNKIVGMYVSALEKK
jgi:nitrate/nitrite-specific signal transduction histidine kinase